MFKYSLGRFIGLTGIVRSIEHRQTYKDDEAELATVDFPNGKCECYPYRLETVKSVKSVSKLNKLINWLESV